MIKCTHHTYVNEHKVCVIFQWTLSSGALLLSYMVSPREDHSYCHWLPNCLSCPTPDQPRQVSLFHQWDYDPYCSASPLVLPHGITILDDPIFSLPYIENIIFILSVWRSPHQFAFQCLGCCHQYWGSHHGCNSCLQTPMPPEEWPPQHHITLVRSFLRKQMGRSLILMISTHILTMHALSLYKQHYFHEQ